MIADFAIALGPMAEQNDTAVPDAELERLYGGDLDEFVAARTAAVKELRRDGKRGEAAAVAALRKPSVAAWIVNRLARADAGLLDELLAAGARLREVQLGAPRRTSCARRSPPRRTRSTRSCARRQRSRRRSGAGGQAALERVRETLHAAALDPDLAAEVRRGVLVREQQAVGFPMGVVVPAPADAARRPPAEAGSAAAGAAGEDGRGRGQAPRAGRRPGRGGSGEARPGRGRPGGGAGRRWRRPSATLPRRGARAERAERARDAAGRRADEAEARHRKLREGG